MLQKWMDPCNNNVLFSLVCILSPSQDYHNNKSCFVSQIPMFIISSVDTGGPEELLHHSVIQPIRVTPQPPTPTLPLPFPTEQPSQGKHVCTFRQLQPTQMLF